MRSSYKMARVNWQLLFVLVSQLLPSMMSMHGQAGCPHGHFQVIDKLCGGRRCRLKICCGRMWKMVEIGKDCRNVICEQLCNQSRGTASQSDNPPDHRMECLVDSIPCNVNETHSWCRNPQATIITCQVTNNISMTDSVSMTKGSTIAFSSRSMTEFVSQPATMFSIQMSSTATASAVGIMNGQSSNLLYVIIVAPMTLIVTAIAVVVAIAIAIVLYRKRKKEQQCQMNESVDISMPTSLNSPIATSDGYPPPSTATDKGREGGITLTNPLYDVKFEDTQLKNDTHEYEHVDSDLIGPRDYEIPVAHSVPPVSEYSTLNMTSQYATLEPFTGLKETPELSQSCDEYSHLNHP